MIPFFLEEFKYELEKYKLSSIRISANPLNGGKNLSIKQSKFLGKPFLPIGMNYPKSKNGMPMIMLAQLNFDEIPTLENYPTTGILQFFVSARDWYDMKDYAVLYHENVECDFQNNFSFLTSDVYEESPIKCEHELNFVKLIEYGGIGDIRFKMLFNGQDYYDFYETKSEAQQDELDEIFSLAGHKIGGYAYFTQSDPREYNEDAKNDLLLLQIDTDDQIMFGDSGVANFFINPEDLKNRNFDKAYFNWDCC